MTPEIRGQLETHAVAFSCREFRPPLHADRERTEQQAVE